MFTNTEQELFLLKLPKSKNWPTLLDIWQETHFRHKMS